MSDVVQILTSLIAIPSVNPAFVPKDHPDAGERRVAEWLGAFAASAGLDVQLVEVAPNRPNLLAVLQPAKPVKHRLILAPHLDTVGATRSGISIFEPRRCKGRIHGRGACDTKGSVAAMISALARVARSGTRPPTTEVVFAGLMDEENGQAGSRAFAASGIKADLAIVGEPTRLQVVSAHKGDLWLEIHTSGKSAHGSTPKLGINAIHRMAGVVELLEKDYAHKLSLRAHPLLGSPTINVGWIQGGTQPNIVPESCSIQVDRRTIPGETEAGVRKEMAELFRTNGISATFGNLRAHPCPALETDTSLPWVKSFLRSAGKRQTSGVNYFCDAAVLASVGIPSLVFGPGDIAQAHTADEWITVESLERAADLLERFLRQLP